MALRPTSPASVDDAPPTFEDALTGLETALRNGLTIIQTGTEQIGGFGRTLLSMRANVSIQANALTMRPSAMPAVLAQFRSVCNKLDSFATSVDGVADEARTALQVINTARESSEEHRIKAEKLSKELAELRIEHDKCGGSAEEIGGLKKELGILQSLNKRFPSHVESQNQIAELKTANADLTRLNEELTAANRQIREDRDKWQRRAISSEMQDPERIRLQQIIRDGESDLISMAQTAMQFRRDLETCEAQRDGGLGSSGGGIVGFSNQRSGFQQTRQAITPRGTLAHVGRELQGADPIVRRQALSGRSDNLQAEGDSDLPLISSRTSRGQTSGYPQSSRLQSSATQPESSLLSSTGTMPTICAGREASGFAAYGPTQRPQASGPGQTASSFSTLQAAGQPESSAGARGKHHREASGGTSDRFVGSKTSDVTLYYRRRDMSPRQQPSPTPGGSPTPIESPPRHTRLSRMRSALTPQWIGKLLDFRSGACN